MRWCSSDRVGAARAFPSLGARIPLSALIQMLAVAEHLSFRHAANTLNVSQSSISARVKALEVELGVLLFERHARGVRLTDAGRHFVERVAVGIDQLDLAMTTAAMTAKGEHGRLRVAVCSLIPGSFLADLLGRYRGTHPGIMLEIAERTAKEAMTQLRDGQLDVAFVAGSPELSDCHSRCIWSEALLVALPTAHKLAVRESIGWSDLRQETFLVCQGGTGPQVQDHIVLRLGGHQPAPSLLRFDVGRGALLSMVGQGFGVTIVGASSSLLPTYGVTFAPIADEPRPIPYSAVWSPYNRSPALKNLLQLTSEMGCTVRSAA